MAYRTEHGKHYHEEYGCHGATIPCDTKGLSPCSDCCGNGKAGDDAGTEAGVAGGSAGSVGSGAGGEAVFSAEVDSGAGQDQATGVSPLSDSVWYVPFLTDEENAAFIAEQEVRYGAGFQGDPLDSYDTNTSATHSEALSTGGVDAAVHGLDAPEPRYGVVPEAYASFTDAISAFGVEPLICPERIPESWGSTEPAPEPLPNWDAPLRAPDEYWFYEMDAYSPDHTLSQQVAAAVAPAMEKWPGATSEMLKYGLQHGFMTAPASTCFHLNTPGGLACHSASVTAAAIDMLERPENKHIREELGPDWREITAVTCLWHDACKLDFYEPLDHPKTRNDGRVAYYCVAESRQNDHRHGEISEDIVRRFYGKALPEVAYRAISLHMGKFDHRCTPKWAKDALDEGVQQERAEKEAAKRAKQDEDIASGKIWWQLKKKVDSRRELAERIRGKGDIAAAQAIAASTDPHAKRADILLSRIRRSEGDDPAVRDMMGELQEMRRSYESIDRMDDIAVAQGVLADDRGHQDATNESRLRRAMDAKARGEAFEDAMAREWEEHPFVRIIHEADAWSASQGR